MFLYFSMLFIVKIYKCSIHKFASGLLNSLFSRVILIFLYILVNFLSFVLILLKIGLIFFASLQKTICSSTTTSNCDSPVVLSAELADIVNDTKVITTHQDVGLIANIIQKIDQLSAIKKITFEETKNVIIFLLM